MMPNVPATPVSMLRAAGRPYRRQRQSAVHGRRAAAPAAGQRRPGHRDPENFARTLQNVRARGELKHIVAPVPATCWADSRRRWSTSWRHIKKIVPAWQIDGARMLRRSWPTRGGRSRPALSMDDVAVQYTGGTTGVPKGAMLSHRNPTATCCRPRPQLQPRSTTPADRQLTILSALPLYHVFAMTVCGLYGLHGMRNVLIINPRDQPSLINAWRRCPSICSPASIRCLTRWRTTRTSPSWTFPCQADAGGGMAAAGGGRAG